MISRHRLRGRRRFAATRAAARRAASSGVRVHVGANHLDVARVGFAPVGLRSAVGRNRLRRRLREAVRPLLGRLAGYDIVVVAGPEAVPLGFADLRTALESTIARAVGRAESADGGSTADNGAMSLTPEVAG